MEDTPSGMKPSQVGALGCVFGLFLFFGIGPLLNWIL